MRSRPILHPRNTASSPPQTNLTRSHFFFAPATKQSQSIHPLHHRSPSLVSARTAPAAVSTPHNPISTPYSQALSLQPPSKPILPSPSIIPSIVRKLSPCHPRYVTHYPMHASGLLVPELVPAHYIPTSRYQDVYAPEHTWHLIAIQLCSVSKHVGRIRLGQKFKAPIAREGRCSHVWGETQQYSKREDEDDARPDRNH
jgi:hypothetical protein